MMEERYSTEKMRQVWSDEGTMALWNSVERYMAEAQGAPREVTLEMYQKRLPTNEIGVKEWKEREATTRHDVVAFVELMRESLSASSARWVHRGVTSSDLVDSAMAVRVAESLRMVEKAGQELMNQLGELAGRYGKTAWVGRTHGQWAQETTMGHLWGNRAMLVGRAIQRVTFAKASQMVMMSGPVGDYRTLGGPEKGRAAERELGRLMMMPVAAQTTQVVARDGLAEAMWACERMMAAVAQVATDIRIMGQSEVGEVSESFGEGQRGSSIMAHKRNTIGAENLVGLERVVRANVMPVVEGIPTWGMRDISHSSVERVCVPLVLSITEFATKRATKLLNGLVVNTDKVAENLADTGGVLAAGPLVAWLTKNGAEPGAAWQVVHEASFGDRELVKATQALVNMKMRNLHVNPGWVEFEGNWAEWR